MTLYSVQQVAKQSGISIRTLHHYDQLGLLSPAKRTEAGYRQYGERELLRLQQILFYREMDFSLKEIASLLDDPSFDLIEALEEHKRALLQKKEWMNQLLQTIDNTISKLKKGKMLTPEELYEGMPKERAMAYREEAKSKWESAFKQSESHLLQMNKQDFAQLKADFQNNWMLLASMRNEAPDHPKVQEAILRHYRFTRQFWGTADSKDLQAEAFLGLGKMYTQDERFTQIEGQTEPQFGEFLYQSIQYFVENSLK